MYIKIHVTPTTHAKKMTQTKHYCNYYLFFLLLKASSPFFFNRRNNKKCTDKNINDTSCLQVFFYPVSSPPVNSTHTNQFLLIKLLIFVFCALLFQHTHTMHCTYQHKNPFFSLSLQLFIFLPHYIELIYKE